MPRLSVATLKKPYVSPAWPVKVADVSVVWVKNGVNWPPLVETKISYEAMLLAP